MNAEEKSSLFSLSIDDTTQSHLLSIAKWHKFIAITGMVGCSVILSIAIFNKLFIIPASLDYTYDVAEITGEIIVYLIFIGAFFIPCIFELKFAKRMVKGINGNDQFLINDSLRQLKIFSKYMGILIIISIAFVLLALFVGLFSRLTNT